MPTIVKYILVFFISMVPIIELRGAVPIGVTYFGLNEYITLAVCVVGNMIPVRQESSYLGFQAQARKRNL